MPDVLVGDRVESKQHGIGVVVSVWGSFAAVKFSFDSKHVNLNDLRSLDADERQRQYLEEENRRQIAARGEYERRKLEEELERGHEEQRAVLLGDLRKAMQADFLKADEFYKSQCLPIVSHKQYEAEKSTFVKEWLSAFCAGKGLEYRPPDDEQCAAIAAVNGHVQVIARAGSGKTTTLVNRTLFLLRHCRVAPGELLLLAFNRKAALEIRRRLLVLLGEGAQDALDEEIAARTVKAGKRAFKDRNDIEASAVDAVAERLNVYLPHVLTFHALAYSVVHPEENILFDGPEGEAQGLSRVFQGVIDDHLQNPVFHGRLRQTMMAHFRADWDRIVEGGFDKSQAEQLKFRRSIPRQSLSGEPVKSYGEKVIADFLFEHGIEYKYERNHWWDGINYKPDFTIFLAPKEGVIIEYFGLVGDPDYDAMSQAKVGYWKGKTGWSLISIVPTDISLPGVEAFREKLKSTLIEHQVSCEPLSEDEIWNRLKGRAIDRFTKAVVGFIGRCRKRSWSPADLQYFIDRHSEATDVEGMFLDLSHDLYGAYLSQLSATGEDDFDGLIQRAVDKIESGETRFLRKSGAGDFKALRFVCIDEFQDFSDLFDRLLKAIRKENSRLELFCVGDDWQAINGFAGSDLKFFEDFPTNVGEASRLYISTNYRSEKPIVEVGNALMAGLGKSAVASKSGAGKVRLCDMADFEPNLIEKQRYSGDVITPAIVRMTSKLLSEGKDVVLLCRRNGLPWFVNYDDSQADGRGIERFLNHVRGCFPKDLHHRISISTAHKYKGLEKSAVIAMDVVARSYPLIHPDWVFSRVFDDSPLKITKEERRLLYVAITRAIDTLIVITDGKNQSPFLEEISRNKPIPALKWNQFPAVNALTNQRLVAKVKSTSGYRDQGGTFPIKDLLHAARYMWHAERKVWEKSFPVEGFELEKVKSEVWAKAADNVEVSFADEADNTVAMYSVRSGVWTCTVESWSLLVPQAQYAGVAQG